MNDSRPVERADDSPPPPNIGKLCRSNAEKWTNTYVSPKNKKNPQKIYKGVFPVIDTIQENITIPAISTKDITLRTHSPPPPSYEECAKMPENGTLKDPTTVYDNILYDIRDMRVLSPYQIYYLKGVSRHKLLHVVATYNIVMRSVNEVL
jgi:hypothetical protein